MTESNIIYRLTIQRNALRQALNLVGGRDKVNAHVTAGALREVDSWKRRAMDNDGMRQAVSRQLDEAEQRLLTAEKEIAALKNACQLAYDYYQNECRDRGREPMQIRTVERALGKLSERKG